MSSIFHYTDSVGLLGILSSRSLFATDYRYLNDATEGSMIQDLIMPVLESEIAEIMPKLVSARLVEGYYEFHGVSGHRSQAEGFYRSMVNVINDVSPLFVLSFCRHEEGSQPFQHGLLSQWRAYAGSSGGFAIELDEDKLDDLMKRETELFAYGGFRTSDVRYEKYHELFDSKMYKGVAGEMIRKLFEPRDVSQFTGRKDFDRVVIDFVNTAPFLKHNGFQEEREYRICAACIRRPQIPKEIKKHAKEIKFRTRNSGITPYIELGKGLVPSLPLKAIIVGPHPFQDRQTESVKLALEEAHFPNVQVRASAIPYRV